MVGAMSALRSQIEIVTAGITLGVDRHPIPPMTDPMGAAWRQPKRESIEVDDTHAMMSRETFDTLPEYNWSIPTGVYEGKMWKRLKGAAHWWLCWYGPDPDPTKMAINYRDIIIV